MNQSSAVVESVLLVDDNANDNYLHARSLKKSGMVNQVIELSDGDEALEFFKDYQASKLKYGDDFPPMVVFLDINMPRMNGHEFLEEYHKLADERYKNVKVIMLSSSSLEEDKQKSFKFPSVKGFLSKPLMRDRVSSMLTELKQKGFIDSH